MIIVAVRDTLCDTRIKVQDVTNGPVDFAGLVTVTPLW